MNLLETLPTVIGAAAIAPALLLLWLVIAADERPGPPGMVWAAFLLGAACILLLGVARAPFLLLLHVTEPAWLALPVRPVPQDPPHPPDPRVPAVQAPAPG